MFVPCPRMKIAQSSNPDEVLACVIEFADSNKAYLTRHVSLDLRNLTDRGWTVLGLWEHEDVNSPQEYLGGIWLIRSRFLFWVTYKAYFHPVKNGDKK